MKTVEMYTTQTCPYCSAAKALLRKRMRGLRASLPAEALRRRSEAVCARVMALDAWRDARTVALFIANEHEVQLDGLLDDARSRGVTVAIPAVRAAPTMPPAGPDRIASLPWNRCASANPPLDCMKYSRTPPSSLATCST